MTNFKDVIDALRDGNLAYRQSWELDTFIFMQVPSEIGKDIVPKMQSLPKTAKAEFERRFNDDRYQVSSIYYTDQFAKVNKGNLITGYSPTTSDVLAEDWALIYE